MTGWEFFRWCACAGVRIFLLMLLPVGYFHSCRLCECARPAQDDRGHWPRYIVMPRNLRPPTITAYSQVTLPSSVHRSHRTNIQVRLNRDHSMYLYATKIRILRDNSLPWFCWISIVFGTTVMVPKSKCARPWLLDVVSLDTTQTGIQKGRRRLQLWYSRIYHSPRPFSSAESPVKHT